jgi:isopentenyl-diphosphate delta-isomerase
MTKIIIVNENDEIIGTKERDSLSPDDIHRISCLWLTNSAGDVVLSKRALTKKTSPGKWGCAVSGTVDEGETYDNNITKEIREELGISLTIDQLRVGPKLRISGADRGYFVQWYFYTSDAPLNEYTLDPSEATELRWVTENELRKCITTNPDDFTTGLSISFAELIGT